MNDETIIRLVEETCRVLAKMEFPQSCSHLQPSYNTLVEAAKANHPEDLFLRTLPTIPYVPYEGKGVAPQEMHILFTQLRIALEALQDEGGGAAPRRYTARSILADVDLSGVKLSGARLDGADLRGANLHDADLRDANLTDAILTDADLSDARLNGANLTGTNLAGANLHGVRMQGADLSGLDLSGVNLHDANLSDVDLAKVLRTIRQERPASAAEPAAPPLRSGEPGEPRFGEGEGGGTALSRP
jgi:Pentapeptide repeats (8 copies)